MPPASNELIESAALLFSVLSALGVVVWRLVCYINDANRALVARIDSVDEKRSIGVRELHAKIDATAESLDQKFNTVRSLLDGVKDGYVRREDLDSHVARFEKGLEQVTAAVDRVRVRFDEGFLELVRALSERNKQG